MHSRIYEVSTSRIPMHNRLTAETIYNLVEDEYAPKFFDYVVDISDAGIRNESIKWFVDYLKTFQNIKGQMVISSKVIDSFFEGKYQSFLDYASRLSKASYDEFKSAHYFGMNTIFNNLGYLQEAYDDDRAFYIFDRQAPEGEQLMTLASFMREQKFRPHGSRTYWIGGVLDYHF